MEDQEDEPLTFPVQASITVLPPADLSLYPSPDAAPSHAQSGSPSTQDATFTAFSDASGAVSEGHAAPELVAAVRQTGSGPISLELFGLEDQPDEPIKLAAPAFMTVLPIHAQQLPVGTPAEVSPSATAAEPTFGGMFATSEALTQPAGTTTSYWTILTKLMQVTLDICYACIGQPGNFPGSRVHVYATRWSDS